MSLFRCAACGSPNVVADTQAGGVGYNYIKGAVGTAVLGVGGAAAGIESKQQQVFKCPDCGMTLNYPMSPSIQMLIDIGVQNEEARKKLNLNGHKIDWDYMRQQYKNIEMGPADEQIANRIKQREETLESVGNADKEEFDSIIDFLHSFIKRFSVIYRNSKDVRMFSPESPMQVDDYLTYQSAVTVCIENLWKFIPPPLPSKYREMSLKNEIPTIFASYFIGKVMNEYNNPSVISFRFWGRGGKIKMKREIDLLNLYASSHPFINEFSRTYGKSLLGLDDCGAIPLLNMRLWSIPDAICVKETTENVNYEWILPALSFSKEILASSDFAYKWKLSSTPKLGGYDLSFIIDNYFKHYPEKKGMYDDQKKAYILKKDTSISKGKEIEGNLASIDELKSTIDKNEVVIQQLENKLFGRAKAKAEAESLREKNASLEEEINKLNMLNSTLKQDDKSAEIEIEYYRSIIKYFNGFIAWDLIKSEATNGDGQVVAKHEISRPEKMIPSNPKVDEINSDALKKLKSLYDEGILTQEEYSAKKKQILGI